MSQSSLGKSDWVSKSEQFERDKAKIRQILVRSDRPLDMAQIFHLFKTYFRYLPSIERRMRELVKSGEVIKYEGKVATFELTK